MRLLLGGLLWVSVHLLSASVSAQPCLSDGNSTQLSLPLTQLSVQRVPRPSDGLEPLYNFARVFLKAVQPNPFPEDIVSKALKDEQQDIPRLVQYEAGYVVCLILAIFYLLFMPIAGGVLLWRYFHSREACITSSTSTPPSRYYMDIGVSGSLILITLLLLVGVILAFSTNSTTQTNMRPGLHHLGTNVGIMEDSLESIPLKMESILDRYNIPKEEISKTIQEADDTIGATIVTSFGSDAQEALLDLSIAVEDATGTIDHLSITEMRRLSLQRRHSLLQNGLQRLQFRLDNLRRCSTCDVPDSTNLETDADYRLIPSAQDKLDSLPPKSDVAGLAEQGESMLQGIPQACSEQLAPTTADLLLELDKTQETLMNTSQTFPSLQSFTEFVSQLRATVWHSEGPVYRYSYIRWAVAVACCFVILVIVLLLVAALSLGLPVLFNPTIYSSYPNTRLERTAVTLFQVSMILTCTFSWLCITLVFVTLFFGGNAYSLGCQSFTSGQLFSFLDKEESLFSSLNISQGSETTQPSMSALYQGCKEGHSMFYSMNMNQTFDLEDFLNTTKYLEGFRGATKDMRIKVSDMRLLPDEGRRGLQDFRQIGLENYDYDLVMLLLSKPVVKRNLSALAEELDEKAELPENAVIKIDLKQEAVETRSLHSLVIQQMADAANMSASVMALKNISRTYKDNVDKALTSCNQTDAAMQAQIPYIVSNVSQCTLDKAERCLLRYLDWARGSILDGAMGCDWLSGSMDNVYTAVCLNVIDPWNAFWLCLGWCCVFLVPEIVLSIYVVKRLRVNLSKPTFIGRDVFTLTDVHPEKKQHMEEKPPENTASNIYMTLEDLLDMNAKAVKTKEQCKDT
ncbi:prominin-2-like [Myripristis murdjan]|uniref:prominin-2-like n=1 Tax=Myripristis murdjan TaxID=586833 RepID=UPI001175E071|nr:prominin-2-like [Myripristis murdjan]